MHCGASTYVCSMYSTFKPLQCTYTFNFTYECNQNTCTIIYKKNRKAAIYMRNLFQTELSKNEFILLSLISEYPIGIS